MTAKVLGPDGKKMPGWFSWRHPTNAEHRDAVAKYRFERGREARQRRAAERAAKAKWSS